MNISSKSSFPWTAASRITKSYKKHLKRGDRSRKEQTWLLDESMGLEYASMMHHARWFPSTRNAHLHPVLEAKRTYIYINILFFFSGKIWANFSKAMSLSNHKTYNLIVRPWILPTFINNTTTKWQNAFLLLSFGTMIK